VKKSLKNLLKSLAEWKIVVPLQPLREGRKGEINTMEKSFKNLLKSLVEWKIVVPLQPLREGRKGE
jgi:hypothetical protein